MQSNGVQMKVEEDTTFDFEKAWESILKCLKGRKYIKTLTQGVQNEIVSIDDRAIRVKSERGGKIRTISREDIRYALKVLWSEKSLDLNRLQPILIGRRAIILAILAQCLPNVERVEGSMIRLRSYGQESEETKDVGCSSFGASYGNVNDDRVEKVADAISSLGWNKIVEFDVEEPEYKCLHSIKEICTPDNLTLIAICAGLVDYQLAGDAYQFWRSLENVCRAHGRISSTGDVEDVIRDFLNEHVNARQRSGKKECIERVFNSGFLKRFAEKYEEYRRSPGDLWRDISSASWREPEMKTVVMAMKAFNIAHLVIYGEYANLPQEIPIPVDSHIKELAQSSGIVYDIGDRSVRAAWGKVAEKVSEKLGKKISIFQLDSLLWQLSKKLKEGYAVEYLRSRGIAENTARRLVKELTIK